MPIAIYDARAGLASARLSTDGRRQAGLREADVDAASRQPRRRAADVVLLPLRRLHGATVPGADVAPEIVFFIVGSPRSSSRVSFGDRAGCARCPRCRSHRPRPPLLDPPPRAAWCPCVPRGAHVRRLDLGRAGLGRALARCSPGPSRRRAPCASIFGITSSRASWPPRFVFFAIEHQWRRALPGVLSRPAI